MNKRSRLITDSYNNLKDLQYIFNYNINKCKDKTNKINETSNLIKNELELLNSFGTFDDNNKFVQQVSNDLTNCIFYYEDINNNIIENFIGINFKELNSFNKYNIAPYLAHHIGVYDNNIKIGIISLGHLKVEFDDRLYRVGLMSDMHYNDTSVDMDPYIISNYDGSEYDTDLENALTYYQNNQEILFMCAAGDVSTDSKEHLRNFALNLKVKAPNTPFYSCLGNHDFQATHYEVTDLHDDKDFGLTDELLTRIGIWNEHIIPKDNTIHYFNENTEDGKLSYYIERTIPGTNKTDIYLFLSVDYGVTHATRTTRSSWDCKAAQKMLDYNDESVNQIMQYINSNNRNETQQQYDYQFYNNDVLLWVKQIIENNQNKRIFLFTHQFFIQKAGNNNGLKYYSYGSEYWRISQRDEQQVAYCLCGLQFEFLNKLNNNYHNVVWFTGHSHYSWKWQIIDNTINICTNDYPIYDPKDDDFKQELRYLRKHIYTDLLKHNFDEIYVTRTNFDDSLILEKIINNIDNGSYHIKFIAQAAYTIGRGFVDYNKEYQNTSHININNQIINIPTNYTIVYDYDDYNIYDIDFEVNNETLSLQWINDEYGANWFIINVIDIYNNDTNESILDVFDDQFYESNFIVQTTNIKYAPITKLIHIAEPIDNSTFNIHLPSLARPIPYHVDSYNVALNASEGAIMDVYQNYVDIRGIIFKDDSKYINKYYPLAQYRLNI